MSVRVRVKSATTRLMAFLVLDYADDHDDGIKDVDDADTMSSLTLIELGGKQGCMRRARPAP